MSSSGYPPVEELDLLGRDLGDVVTRIRGGSTWKVLEDRVWRAYVKTEMIVTTMKLGLEVERPGEFVTVSEKESITDHVVVALDQIAKARQRTGSRSYVEALENLRESRNNLRAFLNAARRMNLKRSRDRVQNRAASSSLPS